MPSIWSRCSVFNVPNILIQWVLHIFAFVRCSKNSIVFSSIVVMCHCFFFYFVAPIRIWRVLILQWITRAQQSALLVGVWWHLKYLYLHRRQLRSLPRIQSLRGVMNAQPLRSSPPWLRHDMRYPAVITPPPCAAPFRDDYTWRQPNLHTCECFKKKTCEFPAAFI